MNIKKYLVLLSILIITVCTVVAKQDFAASLMNCSTYSETGNVDTEGMTVQSTKRILGWQGDRCVYKETVNLNGMNAIVTCKLSKPQIQELVSVMNAYSLIQNYSKDNVDTSSLSAVKDNPVVQVWGKFMQDPNTCSLSGIDGFAN